eukprot:1784266-Ditylum_brightwellii.AAC.1
MTLCPNAHDFDNKHDPWTISRGRQDLLMDANATNMETKMVTMEEKGGNYGQEDNYGQGGNTYESEYRQNGNYGDHGGNYAEQGGKLIVKEAIIMIKEDTSMVRRVYCCIKEKSLFQYPEDI